MSIRVLLVDDHKMLREGIKQLLEFDADIVVTGQASNCEEAIAQFERGKCDVAVLDINLPDGSGINLIKSLKKINKNIKVLMLTVHNEVEYLMEAMDKNADGYIMKDSGSGELIKAIKAVYNGERYIQTDLLPAYNARLLRRDSDNDKTKNLTRRELEILKSIAGGKTNKDIADSFDISERTVKNHITNLFKKIDVSDRTQAAVFAIRNNIVNL